MMMHGLCMTHGLQRGLCLPARNAVARRASQHMSEAWCTQKLMFTEALQSRQAQTAEWAARGHRPTTWR